MPSIIFQGKQADKHIIFLFQKNRKFFINHPEFVNKIQGTTSQFKQKAKLDVKDGIALMKIVDVLRPEVETKADLVQF